MNVTVRRAREKDTDAAVALWTGLQAEQEVLDPRHCPSATAAERWRNDFAVWIASDADRVFVAELDGDLVGLVTAHTYWPSPMIEQVMEVYITELVVDPEQRSGGIGERLVDAVRDWAYELGVRRLRAGVLSRNERGRAFWKRQGGADLFVTFTIPLNEA